MRRALPISLLLGLLLLSTIGPAPAHAEAWFLMCPSILDGVKTIQGKTGSARRPTEYIQVQAFDWAAACEAVRPGYEDHCNDIYRRGKFAIHTCACSCLPASMLTR
jgi:hypothetical protein